MININKTSKIKIHWTVSPYDFSIEKQKEIINKVSRKYTLPKDRIKVIPDFILENENGEQFSLTTDIINNIQEPEFQLKLFKDYIKLNKIVDLDFDLLRKIDSEINVKIDYQVYDKYRRYSIKWIKWDNFLSYGKNNYFDFTQLSNLVLLNGAPANQSGKTTFAVDLLHFLLFGKTTKVPTQDKIFNKHTPEATQVIVEGCLVIDNEEYIIKRTLSRPTLEKRTSKSKTTQKVEYYKIIGDSQEELTEYVDNLQEENSQQTNKVIKEAIGKESDFDLMLSITESNLDELIEKKETERGKLLSRWIGLLPIEEKNNLAREKFNNEVKPYLILNRMSVDELVTEIKRIELNINALNTQNIKLTNENIKIEKDIVKLEEENHLLTVAKGNVNKDLLNVNIESLNNEIERITSAGINAKNKRESTLETLKSIGEVNYSVEEFDAAVERLNTLKQERIAIALEYKTLKKSIDDLTKSEYCPTCGRKYDNVDNSKQISQLTEELNQSKEKGLKIAELITKSEKEVAILKENREKYTTHSKLKMECSAIELDMARLREKFKEKSNIKKEYEKNKETIDKNNNIDILLQKNHTQIVDKRNTRDYNLRLLTQNEENTKTLRQEIEKNCSYITRIKEEEKLVRAWKIYLEMVGKDGISKMVLRKTLPIINAKLSQMLSDICDFDVEVGITEKNDVIFYIIKDGVKSDLSSGSGFEKTASALALRAVFSNISSLPKLSGMVMDELWGRVAKDNYDNMRQLVEKIATEYQWVIIITHLEDMKDWCDHTITVSKKNNISKLALANNLNP